MSQETVAAPAHLRGSPLRVGAAVGVVVLAAIVIFGLGVMVGKRVAESAPAVAAAPAALPTEAVPPLPEPPDSPGGVAPGRLTFYDRLSGVAPPTPVALPEAPPAPPAPAPAPAPAAAPAPARSPAAAKAPVKAPVKAAARTTAPAMAPSDAAARIRKLGGRGRFSVQVASVSDRAAAEATAARVRSEGFEALTVMVSVKGKTWYRIRAGSFPSKQAAARAAGIFRSAYGFDAIAVQN